MALKTLFIGGTGVISSACTQLALERGMALHLLNRGETSREISGGAVVHTGDIRRPGEVAGLLKGEDFDVVVDWVAFTPEHIEVDIDLFRGRVGQFVFISSASAYQTPPDALPITESTPLSNPFWDYSRNKIACEARLRQALRDEQFPMTIVRPSHTYDRSSVPLLGRHTMLRRMRDRRPALVHGDGTSLWTLTHHRDFARGFVGLLGHSQAVGEAFHITSDEILTWNQIYRTLAMAAGVEAELVHVPSPFIAAFDPELGAGLLGDKAHSMIFDNSKIKRFVPEFTADIAFSDGDGEIIDWLDADPARPVSDERTDRLIDDIISAYRKAWPDPAAH